MPNDDTIFLKSQVDVLSFFNLDQLRRVTPDIERAAYSKGDMVLFKGEITSGFYIVKKGAATVVAKGAEGNPELLEEGDFFGEMSVLEEIANDSTIKAAADGTEILTIPTESFKKLLEMQPILKKALKDRIEARKKKS